MLRPERWLSLSLWPLSSSESELEPELASLDSELALESPSLSEPDSELELRSTTSFFLSHSPDFSPLLFRGASSAAASAGDPPALAV